MAVLPLASIPESSCSSAALQHSPCSFCAWSRRTREDKKDHLSSPTAFPFLPTTSRCASPASIFQQGIVVAAVLDVHDDVAPSTQPTSLEGSFDRGLLHLQLYPLSILKNLLHLLMVGGSPLCAFPTPSFFYLVRRGVESCREIVISLPMFL